MRLRNRVPYGEAVVKPVPLASLPMDGCVAPFGSNCSDTEGWCGSDGDSEDEDAG